MGAQGFKSDIAKKVGQSVGSLVILQKTVVSTGVTVAAQDLSSVATGEFYIEDIVCETDSTGLAGITNFLVGTNNAKGVGSAMTTGQANLETSQASLGVNKTVALRNVGASASTDSSPTVRGVSGTLEAGKKIQYASTGITGTGAGTCRITVVLRRIAPGAQIYAV